MFEEEKKSDVDNVEEKSESHVANGEQKVKNTGDFFIGLATGVVTTLVVIIIGIVACSLLFKKYIDTSDKNELMQNAGLSNSGDYGDLDDIEDKMEYIQQIIDKYYYYDVDMNVLADSVYAGMLASLGDPYSVYYDKEAFTALMESTSGTYCGIGVVVSQDVQTKEITVVNPYEGCPGYEAGMQPGDIIIGADDIDFTGMDINEAVSYMKGEEGTTVTVHIKRDGKLLDFKVTRKKITIPTVAYEKLEGDIAYIAIASFDSGTYNEFKEKLDVAKADGCKGYIFDVRDNGGGIYDIVVDMLDDLLPTGRLVYTEDKNGNQEIEYSDAKFLDAPMCVLINGNSASASEVFAGAIQDYKVGKLIGTTSFGKGIVQSIMSLGDGTGVKVTISSYFTPNGRNIHNVGITPDIVVELPKEQDAYENGYLKREYDTQLQEAVEYIKGELK